MAIESSNKRTDNKLGKKKEKQIAPHCKIVIRKLPSTYTEEDFKEAIAPVPDHDYFSFVPADKSLGQHAYSRAYINFLNPEEIFNFKEIFDGYVFVDQKGNEFPAIVEYAPFQKTPKVSTFPKKDLRCGTIEEDADYVQFLNNLSNPEAVTLPQIETMLEEIENFEKEQRANNGLIKIKTPLLEYVEQRNGERLRPGERKRRKEIERKQARDEAKRKRKEIIREWRYQKREEKREERKKRDEERQKWREKRDKEDKERRAKERDRKERSKVKDKEKKEYEAEDATSSNSVKKSVKDKLVDEPVRTDTATVESKKTLDVDIVDEETSIKEVKMSSNVESDEAQTLKPLCDKKAKTEVSEAENKEEEAGDRIDDESLSQETERKKGDSRDYDTTEDTPSDSQNSQKDDKNSKDPRTERRIRNKDRPAMQLYRPGQSRLIPHQKKNDEGGGDRSNGDSSSSSSSPVMAFSEEKENKPKEDPKVEVPKEKTTPKTDIKEEAKEEQVKEKPAAKSKESSYKETFALSQADKKPRYRDSRRSGYYYEGESYGKYKDNYGKHKEDYGTYKDEYSRRKDDYGTYKEDFGDYDKKTSRQSGARKGYSYHHERETKAKSTSTPTSGTSSTPKQKDQESVKPSTFRRSTSQE